MPARPRISLVVAMARDGTIGRDKGMPWHLPADLQHFRSLTMGHPVIMGRRTHEAVGRPLPGRLNIVVSRHSAYRAPGCTVAHTLEAALDAAEGAGEIFIIGGGEIYRQAMDLAQRLHVTEIDADVQGDTHFPAIDPQVWREAGRSVRAADERNAHAMAFVLYERRPGPAG